ncbi:MAG: PfkB family carbohydrate kinase [Bacteroidota bacterium]
MSQDPLRVVIAGSATIDEQRLSGKPAFRAPGGVPLYGGGTFRRLGWEVEAVTRLGAGFPYRSVYETLGVRLRVEPSADTTTFVNHIALDGIRRQDLLAIAGPIEAEALAEIDPPDVLLLAPLHGEDLAAEVYTEAQRHACVALDVQGLTRSSSLGLVRHDTAPAWSAALNAATHVKIAADERPIFDAARLRSAYGIAELIITNGARGGTVYTDQGIVRYAPVPVAREHDPTGAGDVFFAAYLAARFTGSDVEHAANHAAQTAARQVAGEWLRF